MIKILACLTVSVGITLAVASINPVVGVLVGLLMFVSMFGT